MNIPSIITIDGPAASGKSTLGQHLAEELGYLYFDTGVMYRALTWEGLQRGIPIEDGEQLCRLAQELEIDVRAPSTADGRAYDVWVNGVDVTWDIRRKEVDANVSVVSAYAGVRAALSAQQRRIGLRGRVVMVGRDIGTVVLPQADLKIYLDASAEERARRRYQELLARNEQASYEAVLQAVQRRDWIDSTRDVAPLRAADDAVVLVTDHMDAGQVLEAARKLVYKDNTPEND
jgi:cytidylate kinase